MLTSKLWFISDSVDVICYKGRYSNDKTNCHDLLNKREVQQDSFNMFNQDEHHELSWNNQRQDQDRNKNKENKHETNQDKYTSENTVHDVDDERDSSNSLKKDKDQNLDEFMFNLKMIRCEPKGTNDDNGVGAAGIFHCSRSSGEQEIWNSHDNQGEDKVDASGSPVGKELIKIEYIGKERKRLQNEMNDRKPVSDTVTSPGILGEEEKVNILVGTSVVIHECSICKKVLKSKQTLKAHKLLHTGDKPFRCEDCGQRFVQSHSLQYHKNKVHSKDQFECNICHKVYYSRCHLTKHVKAGHTVKSQVPQELNSDEVEGLKNVTESDLKLPEQHAPEDENCVNNVKPLLGDSKMERKKSPLKMLKVLKKSKILKTVNTSTRSQESNVKVVTQPDISHESVTVNGKERLCYYLNIAFLWWCTCVYCL